MTRALVSGSWLAFWRCLQRYHRYDVEGFEHLAAPGATLIVGYHGRGFAVDLCLLSVVVHDRLGTSSLLALCRPEKSFWVFKATVFKSSKCRGFVGYGDAHPGNVSPLIFNNAELRMAETRAVNRALRKAYAIALCSAEELGPGALTPEQIPALRRTLQSRPPFQKGASHENQNPRTQPTNRKGSSRRRPLPGPRRTLRARRSLA